MEPWLAIAAVLLVGGGLARYLGSRSLSREFEALAEDALRRLVDSDPRG